MVKFLLQIPALLFSLAVSAQITLTADPVVATGTGPKTATDIAAYSHVTNNSTIPVSLLWSRTMVSAPHEWTSWVCDLNNCYLPFVGVCPDNLPIVLDPGESFELSMHVDPDGFAGEAAYFLHLFDLSQPEIKIDSVQFVFQTTTTSVSDVNGSSLRIYPNPTTSYFQISNPSLDVARVIVYNIVGNKMREFDARNNNRFDVANLAEGIYLVRLMDAKDGVLKTVRLSKR